MRFLLGLLGLFICELVFGSIQHKPITSSLHHGLSSGFVFELSEEKRLFSRKGGGILNYTYYLSFWDKWLPEKYQGYLNWGLKAGAGAFFNSPGFCREDPYYKPLLLQGGVQLRGVYWEYFQPFAEVSLSHLFCYRKLKDTHPSSEKLRALFSFGASVSLKIFDRRAIYSLDEDYGLNDLAFTVQCLQVRKISESEGRLICLAGLEALF